MYSVRNVPHSRIRTKWPRYRTRQSQMEISTKTSQEGMEMKENFPEVGWDWGTLRFFRSSANSWRLLCKPRACFHRTWKIRKFRHSSTPFHSIPFHSMNTIKEEWKSKFSSAKMVPHHHSCTRLQNWWFHPASSMRHRHRRSDTLKDHQNLPRKYFKKFLMKLWHEE